MGQLKLLGAKEGGVLVVVDQRRDELGAALSGFIKEMASPAFASSGIVNDLRRDEIVMVKLALWELP